MAQRFSKIFAVTGAVLTCVSIPSYASFNGLTEQDEFNIKLRSIYFDRDYDNDASDDSTFAQGIELNYQSKGRLKLNGVIYIYTVICSVSFYTINTASFICGVI